MARSCIAFNSLGRVAALGALLLLGACAGQRADETAVENERINATEAPAEPAEPVAPLTEGGLVEADVDPEVPAGDSVPGTDAGVASSRMRGQDPRKR